MNIINSFKKGSRLNHTKIMELLNLLLTEVQINLNITINNKTLFLANSVLSVCGKINSSNRLYSSINKKHFIAYNGEIYNYKSFL